MPARALFPLMLVRTAGLPLGWLDALAVNWLAVDHELEIAERDMSVSQLSLQSAFDAFFILPANQLPTLDDPLRTTLFNARRAFFQKQKLPPKKTLAEWHMQADHYPTLLPLLTAIAARQQAERALDAASVRYRQHREAALHQAWRALQDLAGESEFQRALLFASHDLLGQLPRFHQASPEAFTKKDRQTAMAVLQYATRIAAKTSPFSRFTTLSLHRLEEAEESDAPDFGKAIVTPNVALLEALYDVLLREPAFYRALSVALNPCIVRLETEQYDWLYFDGQRESFQQGAASPALNFTVETLLSHDRQLPFPDLLGVLSEAANAPSEALEAFLHDLIDTGLLEWVLPNTGLSVNWCSGLYQFLGFLPSPTPVIVEAAALVQWLRTAARTLPFQSVEAARETQVETAAQIRAFFDKFGGVAPPLPPEQVFFEDVEKPVDLPVPSAVLHDLANQLGDCWQARARQANLPVQSSLEQHWQETWPEQEKVGFLKVARSYLEDIIQRSGVGQKPDAGENPPESQRGPLRIGVLLQCYRDKSGQWQAVVNALFPGGGKLMARWTHLFSADLRHQLEQWTAPLPGLPPAIPFPWQGWHNANFQPPTPQIALGVAGGRLRAGAGGQSYWLGDVDVVKKDNGFHLQNGSDGGDFSLTDLGLEAPETRPPAMRLLWELGVPAVSVEMLRSAEAWQPFYDSGRYRARQTWHALTLAREAWEIVPATWQWWLRQATDHLDFFRKTRQALTAMGVPRRFFARFAGQKPQYFDRDSPALMLLFEKSLHGGAGALVLEETLPEAQEGYATEIVMEIQV